MPKFPSIYQRRLRDAPPPAQAGWEDEPLYSHEETGQRIQADMEAAKNAIELTTLKRQADETMLSALRDAEEAPDEESAAKIREAAEAGVFKLQAKNIRVQNAFSAHVEESLAGWKDRFAQQAKAIKEKRLFDQSEINVRRFVEAGRVDEAAKQLEIRRVAFPELGAQIDEEIRNLPMTSAIAQASGALAGGDLQGARGFIEQARKLPLSVEQKESINKLEGVIERGEQQRRDAWLSEMVGQAIAARSLPSEEKYAKVEELRKMLVQNTAMFPAETIREMHRFLDGILAGRTVKSDPKIKSDFIDAALQIRDDTPESEVKAFLNRLDTALTVGQTLSDEDYESLRLMVAKRGDRTDKATADMLDAVTESAKQRGINDLADFKWQLSQDAKKNNWTPEQVWTEGSNRIPAWKDAPSLAIYTPAHVQGVFGDIKIGGRILPGNPPGVITFWQDDTKSKAWEKAVAHALVNLEGDQANLDQAMRLIKEKYPEAEIVPGQVSVPWTSLPEEVKRRDFEALSKAKVTGGWIWKSYEPVGGWTQDQITKAHEEGMTPEKFGAWLREKGQIRMVPAPAVAKTPPVASAPVRVSTRAAVESLPRGTQYFWKDETRPRIRQ